MASSTTISIQLPSETEPTSFHLVSQKGDAHGLESSSFQVSHVQLGSGMYHHFGPIEISGLFEQPVKPQVIFFCHTLVGGKSGPGDPPLTSIVLKAFLHTDASRKFLPEEWEECRSVMEKEAHFYHSSLSELQGVVVPKHHGIWRSERTKKVGIVQCQILQYGGKTLKEVEWRSKDKLAIAAAAEKLHDYGIYHGQLSIPQIEHHILCNHEGKVFIIDFSEALDHWMCIRTIPLVPLQGSLGDVAAREDRKNKDNLKMQLCDELQHVARFLGFDWCDSGYPRKSLEVVVPLIAGKTLEERRKNFEKQRQSLDDLMAASLEEESEEGLIPIDPPRSSITSSDTPRCTSRRSRSSATQ